LELGLLILAAATLARWCDEGWGGGWEMQGGAERKGTGVGSMGTWGEREREEGKGERWVGGGEEEGERREERRAGHAEGSEEPERRQTQGGGILGRVREGAGGATPLLTVGLPEGSVKTSTSTILCRPVPGSQDDRTVDTGSTRALKMFLLSLLLCGTLVATI